MSGHRTSNANSAKVVVVDAFDVREAPFQSGDFSCKPGLPRRLDGSAKITSRRVVTIFNAVWPRVIHRMIGGLGQMFEFGDCVGAIHCDIFVQMRSLASGLDRTPMSGPSGMLVHSASIG